MVEALINFETKLLHLVWKLVYSFCGAGTHGSGAWKPLQQRSCATLKAQSLTFAVGEPGTYVQASPEAKGTRGCLLTAFQLPDLRDQVETILRGRTAGSGFLLGGNLA